MRRIWTDYECQRLANMILSGDFTYTEIAERLKRSYVCVQQKTYDLGLKNPIKTKHKHLRRAVLEYFLTHSWNETQKQFSLTKSELKSVFTSAYRDPQFRHLRKDKRRHDSWTLDEWLFLVRRAGIRPRSFIAKKLKRGSARCIKERLQASTNGKCGTKFLNGMPEKWAKEIWGNDVPLSIKTDAGPSGARGTFHFRIIPWTECNRFAATHKTDKTVKACIMAMNRFQTWIHGTKSSKKIRENIEGILRER